MNSLERAFMNDKLDLAQAEAIADLIEATSEQAVRSAMQSLQGEFSTRIHQLVDSADESAHLCGSRYRLPGRRD